MLKNDYMQKITEKLTGVLSNVLGLKSAGMYEEALNLINDEMYKTIGLDPEMIDSYNSSDLVNILKAAGGMDSGRSLFASSLLREEGEIYGILGNEDKSISKYIKAFQIFYIQYENNEEFIKGPYGGKMEETADQLIMYSLDYTMMMDLLDFYSLRGSYSKCEDILFDMMDENPESIEVVQRGLEFYTKLLNKDHDELLKGNLPIDEVHDAMKTLVERMNRLNRKDNSR